jgi:hypothetical protein
MTCEGSRAPGGGFGVRGGSGGGTPGGTLGGTPGGTLGGTLGGSGGRIRGIRSVGASADGGRYSFTRST